MADASLLSIDQSNASIIWKNDSNKLKGEVLMSKMKYEIESLNRQINYLKEEKELVKRNYENKILDLKTRHENELSYERERQNLTAAETIFCKLHQHINEQNDFILQLKKLEDEIAFEADQIQHVVDEDYSEELVRLRQIRVIQQERVRHLEKENSKLDQLTVDLKNELRDAQTKIVSIQRDALSQKQNEMNNGSIEKESLFAEKEVQYKNEIEQLKCAVQKLEQKPAVEEFETSQKISKMETEISRLKKINEFLRTKKKREMDSNGEESTLDSEEDESNDMEQVLSDIFQHFKIGNNQANNNNLEDKFWKLSKWCDIAKLRIEDARSQQLQAQLKLNNLTTTFNQKEVDYLAKITNLTLSKENLSTSGKLAHMKEIAELIVQIQLQREKISDMEEESIRRTESYQKLQKLVSLEDAKRFSVMYHQMMSVKNQMRGYKIREQLWTSLIENQRKRIDSLQDKLQKSAKNGGSIDHHTLLQDQREEQESEMEATRLLNELQVLTSKSAQEYEQNSSQSTTTSPKNSPTLIPSSTSSTEHQTLLDNSNRDEILLLVDQKCLIVHQQLTDTKNQNEQLLQHCHKLKLENEQLRMIHSSMKLDSERLSLSVQHLDRQVNELKQVQQQLRREKLEAVEQARKRVEEQEATLLNLRRKIKEQEILLQRSLTTPSSQPPPTTSSQSNNMNSTTSMTSSQQPVPSSSSVVQTTKIK